MAKDLLDISFDLKLFETELTEFKNLLDSKIELDENEDILPFFKRNKILASQISTLFPDIQIPGKMAFEYDIFGDFCCDLIVGDHVNNSYCLIEFEDAKRNSLFKKNGKKFKPEFGVRLEHGYSQIIDWFYHINSIKNTKAFFERFNALEVDFFGILIIGRSHFLDKHLEDRLAWRSKMVTVNSKRIYIYTYDELLQLFNTKLNTYKSFLCL